MKSKNKIWEFIKSDLWIVLLDILAVTIAYWLALNARFIGYSELGDLFHSYLTTLFHFAPFYAAICIVVFSRFGLYDGMWKYAGMHDMNRILMASGICSISYIF